MKPNFIIIGAQKSASTFVQECLREHPEIYMPYGETPYFETPDYEETSSADFVRAFDGQSKKVVGIKRPNYLASIDVPGRIEQHNPDARIIVILRNPIDRAISAYFHYMNYGFIPVSDIEKGLSQVLYSSEYQNKYKRANEIIEFGRYSKYLDNYSAFENKGNLLVLLQDDVISSKQETMRKIYNFLEVDTNYIAKSLKSRPQRVIYNYNRLSFLNLRAKFIYNYNDSRTRLYKSNKYFIGKYIGKGIQFIDRYLLALIYKNKKPQLSKELLTKLKSIYHSDIRELENKFSLDLTKWK